MTYLKNNATTATAITIVTESDMNVIYLDFKI